MREYARRRGKPRVEVVSVAVWGEITQGGWLSIIGSADIGRTPQRLGVFSCSGLFGAGMRADVSGDRLRGC